MALAGELAKYIGNEMIKTGGKELAKATATSTLSSLVPKVATDVATKTALGGILPSATNSASDGMMTLYRGLTQKYDPNYPVAKLDTSGYESWTDNKELARKYGDNVYSIEVPKSDIKTSYLDEDPMSPTYGDRNPIYEIDKKAGLDGVSGKEYLLEVGSDYQKGLKYNPVYDDEMSMAIRASGADNEVATRAMNFLSKKNIPVETAGYSNLVNKAKGYKSLDRFEKMNNPIKGSEIWGEKPTSAFQRDSRAVRINMFPNDAVKGTGITKQYLLNLFKDAYDQGITDIVPSYGSYTKDGASFMDHLAEQGWVKDVSKNGWKSYEISPKIAEWEKTSPLVDIYNNAHNIPEVQLDDDIAKQLDKAMGYLKEKRNIPVETTGEYPNDFSRIPVRFTNKEIDTLHKYTGKIPDLYHQTSASSLGDMTLDRRRGVSGDSGMPEGIFLKDNDKDIGLMGKNQLALNAKMENPAYFKDRADLDNFMRSRGAKDLMSRRKELDDYYQKLSDEAEKKQHDLAMIAWDNPTPENKALAKQAMEDWQKITEEWNKAVDNNGEVAREGIRNTLVNNGYDSAIIENDEGSGGRSVKSYIVFDKNQLSPRYNKGISFDPNDVKSIYAETAKRQKKLDELMDKVTDLVEASGDKATYKSGGNKSIESMTNKVARKMASGRDYRLMDMKDHMRGAVMLENLNNDADEITNLLEILQYELDQPVGIEVVDTDLGYSGLHLTWRDEDGLGYEIQVTTPEVWKTKLASDKLYDEVRNWTSSELNADPAKKARYNEVKEASKALWDKTWKKLGGRPNLKPLESFNDDIYFY